MLLFFHYCVQIPDKKQLKEQRNYFGRLFQNAVHHSREDMATGTFDCLLTLQWPGSRVWTRSGVRLQGPTFRDSLPSARPHLPKIPQFFQTALLAEDQVFKPMSLCVCVCRFHIQNIISSYCMMERNAVKMDGALCIP